MLLRDLVCDSSGHAFVTNNTLGKRTQVRKEKKFQA